MPDYEALYFRVFNRISDIIKLLQELQQDMEELYIENGEPDIKALPLEESS